MSLEVTKVVPAHLDVGNLAVFDINVLDDAVTSNNKVKREAGLLALTRDNTQLLINDLFVLPTTSTDVGAVASLPPPTTVLPRGKPVPKPKEPTRWEKFAKAKGIVKRKKGSHAYDEDKQKWRPRFGAKSKKNDPMNNWITELKPGQSIPDDQ
ncbi:Ribosomal biogenesis regulatory protein domain-containing protein [Paramicrosporidium saccamoebae]|uniref:Ribosome biogenesis regulatory protein n=1 Tax=Paramicrosporidium saccamoebae TaxID=1246581 RepID=A0A2H9TID6_9FUNG|nr:Ribosomal biogenesis regulatory protein domain-containing protein [Paramicrosporidium saccamoebae]